jgi:hypothetical protein
MNFGRMGARGGFGSFGFVGSETGQFPQLPPGETFLAWDGPTNTDGLAWDDQVGAQPLIYWDD